MGKRPFVPAVFLLCMLLPLAGEAGEKDSAGAKLVGIHDSDGRDALAPGFFVYFDPLFVDAEFGSRVWQIRLREDITSKDFDLAFHIQAKKENIGGALEAVIPTKKKYKVKGAAGFGGDAENKLYFTAMGGLVYEHAPTRQKFSLDVVQDIGRKNGTLFRAGSSQELGAWSIEQGAQISSFGACGFFIAARRGHIFGEVAHYGDFDYSGLDRTRAGIGMQFNF